MKKTNKLEIVFCAGVFILVIAALLATLYRPINKVSNRREVTATVTGKEVKNKEKDSKYLVYTKDNTGEVAVYEITDALFAGRFNSSDVYAGIEIGKTYKFEIGGSRIKILSWYPNIYEYTELEGTSGGAE